MGETRVNGWIHEMIILFSLSLIILGVLTQEVASHTQKIYTVGESHTVSVCL